MGLAFVLYWQQSFYGVEKSCHGDGPYTKYRGGEVG